MSIIGARSGENQIAILSRGINQLPLEPLDGMHLQVIFETLIEAWGNLIAEGNTQAFQDGEESLNRLMVSELNNMRDSKPSEWGLLVSSAQDAANIPNVNGRRIGKQPDISLIFTRIRSSNFPFIIECKLIGSTKSVGLYCEKGLSRFLQGEYAWYEQQAVMLAYVQDQSTTQDKLSPHLKKYQLKQNDLFQTVRLPEFFDCFGGKDLAKSEHERYFSYVGDYTSSAPGNISLWHLWLNTPSDKSKL